MKILSDGKPRKARDLVEILRADLRRDDIDKHVVNSVLYRDLSNMVKCDAAFNWHLPRTEPLSSKGAAEAPTNAQRPELVRTIYRLRSGLPPCENLEDFTVGGHRFVDSLQDLLRSRASQRAAWAIARGDYGGGKTHLLALFSEMARRESYATCHLSSDGYANALNHPQRFLPMLLATLEVPRRRTYGYTDLLYDVLSDLQLARRLRELTGSYLDGWSSVAIETRTCLDRIIELLGRGPSESEEWSGLVRYVTYHLTGDSIRHLSATPNNRQTAYHLISIARDLVREVGMRGLAICIDEVESIYSKLPNVRSRIGALRVLAGLCQLAHCRVLLAVTPDAYRDLISELPLATVDGQALPSENVAIWAGAVGARTVPILDCRPLSAEDRKKLLRLVRQAYAGAYDDCFASDGFERAWERHVQSASTLQVPVRLVVRRAVDLMDSFRYAQK